MEETLHHLVEKPAMFSISTGAYRDFHQQFHHPEKKSQTNSFFHVFCFA